MQKKWSIVDLFAVTACAVLWITIHGSSRQDYVSYLYLLVIGGLASSSLLQIKNLLFSPEGQEIAAINRQVWWMLFIVRLAAVILLLLGSRWPPPGLWFSSGDPPPLIDSRFDVGTGQSFAMCNAVGRSILPVGMLLSMLPLWSTPPRKRLSLRQQRMREIVQIGLVLTIIVIMLYSAQSIAAILSMAVVSADNGIAHLNTRPDSFDRWGDGVASLVHGTNAGMAFLIATLLAFGFCFSQRRSWQWFGWIGSLTGLGLAIQADWRIRLEYAPAVSISLNYLAEPLNWRVYWGIALSALVLGWIMTRVLIQHRGTSEFTYSMSSLRKFTANPWLIVLGSVLLAIANFSKFSFTRLMGSSNLLAKWWDQNSRNPGTLSERMGNPFGNFGDLASLVLVVLFLAIAFQTWRARYDRNGSVGIIRSLSVLRSLAIWIVTSAILVVGCDLAGWSARTSLMTSATNWVVDPLVVITEWRPQLLPIISAACIGLWAVGNLVMWAWRPKK